MLHFVTKEASVAALFFGGYSTRQVEPLEEQPEEGGG